MSRDWLGDDAVPERPTASFDPRQLDALAIGEIEAYIGVLTMEIQRCRAAIEAKQRHRGGAEALFRTSADAGFGD